MTSLVQIGDTPQMSACGYCPKPGYCCQGFDLANQWGELTFGRDDWREASAAFLAERDLPFEASGIRDNFQGDDGRQFVTLWYRCPKITPEGRCSIYETRPETCRIYVPGSTRLCVLHGLV